MPILIRFKALLFPILLLFIPLLCFPLKGLLSSSGLEYSLVEMQKSILNNTAEEVSKTLSSQPDLFQQKTAKPQPTKPEAEADPYIRQLSVPIQLDGDTDDWQPELSNAKIYGKEYLLLSEKPNHSLDNLSFRHLTGSQGEFLYALFDVRDDHVSYRYQNTLRLDGSDHLQIIIDNNKEKQKYIVAGRKPGWVVGFYIPEDPSEVATHEKRIHGSWKQTETGYILEIRISKEILGDTIVLAIADVDDNETGSISNLMGTTIDKKKVEKPEAPPENSIAIQKILESVDRPDTRIVVVDENKQVRADTGEPGEITNHPPATDKNPTPKSPEIDMQGIVEAFAGKSSITHYFKDDSHVEAMAAVKPVYEEEKVVAVVIVEQTTGTVKSLNKQLTQETISLFVITFLLGAGTIFLFSFRLSKRFH